MNIDFVPRGCGPKHGIARTEKHELPVWLPKPQRLAFEQRNSLLDLPGEDESQVLDK
jgi:hypothetical protein